MLIFVIRAFLILFTVLECGCQVDLSPMYHYSFPRCIALLYCTFLLVLWITFPLHHCLMCQWVVYTSSHLVLKHALMEDIGIVSGS